MPKVNQNIISVSVVLLLVITIVGVSYAYFTANITGVENASTISMTAGRMVITYSGENNIEVKNIYPRAEEWATKKFALTGTNTTALDMKYKLYLTVDNNTFSNNTLTCSLTGTSPTENEELVNAANIAIPNGPGNVELGTSKFSNAEDVIHNYELKIYFLDNGNNQNIDQGKEFAGHITVEGVE